MRWGGWRLTSSVKSGGSSFAAPNVVNPAIVQMVASSTNIFGVQGQAGSNFKFTLPNTNGASNCVALCMSYPNGTTITITDGLGNTWPASATKAADAGAGLNVGSIWILPNANGGVSTYHVACSPAAIPFQYVIIELCGIDANPVNSTSAGTASVTGPNLTTGSFTPDNNDATGGNFILAYYALSSGSSSAGRPTSFVAGGPFTLLEADTWTGVQSFPQAAQYFLQTSHAAINPGMTATGDSADAFNCVAVALKVNKNNGIPKPAAGSGKIWIDRIYHFSTTGSPNATWTVQAPRTGNLCLLHGHNTWTSVTDSDGGSWTKRGSAGSSAIWESVNKSPSPDYTLTISTGGDSGGGFSFRLLDISNAAASPFEVFASAVSATLSLGTTVVNDLPDITPLTAPALPNLVIAAGFMGIGPCTGFNIGAPANAVFDLCTYPEETDGSSMENADILAHVLVTSTTPLTWNWTIKSQPGGTGADCCAAVYKHA